jgi:dolichyl-phosphate-mannose--protein O-mannosyl transferase
MYIKHFLARVSCLIIIPIGFYMAMFAIHFTCLVNPGDGDGFMSSEVSPSSRPSLTIVPTNTQLQAK